MQQNYSSITLTPFFNNNRKKNYHYLIGISVMINKSRRDAMRLHNIVIYEPSAGRRCSRMSAVFKARATKERVPLINALMNGRCLHASGAGSYNIFRTKIKLFFFCFNTLNINEHKTK
jgi:hypothetical protein